MTMSFYLKMYWQLVFFKLEQNICFKCDNDDYDDDGDDDDHNDDDNHDDGDDVGYPANSHHDKNPPWWEFVSNEYGGNMPVTKSHHW